MLVSLLTNRSWTARKSLQSNEEVHVSGKIYPLRLDFLAKKWKPIKHSSHKTVIFSINEEMFQQHHKGSFIASLLLKVHLKCLS